MNRIVAVFCIIALIAVICSCGNGSDVNMKNKSENLTSKFADEVYAAESTEADIAFPEGVDENVYNFAVDFLKAANISDTNIMISPISVLMAMTMLEKGAEGNSLKQMEEVFGCDVKDMSYWLKAYSKLLPSTDKTKVNITNSLWLKNSDGFNVNEDFVKAAKFYFNAQIYKTDFSPETVGEINGWCKENTYGMIEKIISDIAPETMAYIINAVAFDGEWQEIYEKNQIKEENFTTEEGKTQKAQMMYSQETIYLEDNGKDSSATGFIKPYKDGYSFVALLPSENITVDQYLDKLTGKRLKEVIDNGRTAEVHAVLPQFKYDHTVDNMIEIFKNMGITDIFDMNESDLSGLGAVENANLYVSEILHKTHIDVNAKGTKAAAVTSIGIKCTSCAPVEKEIYYVRLDRPFVYAIIDDETQTPMFIGTMMSVK